MELHMDDEVCAHCTTIWHWYSKSQFYTCVCVRCVHHHRVHEYVTDHCDVVVAILLCLVVHSIYLLYFFSSPIFTGKSHFTWAEKLQNEKRNKDEGYSAAAMLKMLN